jgi:hypothetical protein
VVVADLLEAATEVAAEATVVESTRSIQINPAKSKRARANATVGPVSCYLSSPRLFVAVISAAPRSYMSSAGNYEHRAIPFFWSNGSWCIAIPHWVPLRIRPGNVTLPNTAGAKAFLPAFHSPENRKDGKS